MGPDHYSLAMASDPGDLQALERSVTDLYDRIGELSAGDPEPSAVVEAATIK